MIFEIFILDDVLDILKLPIGDNDVPNKLIWHFEKWGLYTVKSGYMVARDCLDSGLSNLVHGWTKLWQLHIPPRVKLFLLRACCNYLLTRDRLYLKSV